MVKHLQDLSFSRLNMFFYDPKLKKKLPYYDTFPLVLPLENYSDGFLGLNFQLSTHTTSYEVTR